MRLTAAHGGAHGRRHNLDLRAVAVLHKEAPRALNVVQSDNVLLAGGVCDCDRDVGEHALHSDHSEFMHMDILDDTLLCIDVHGVSHKAACHVGADVLRKAEAHGAAWQPKARDSS